MRVITGTARGRKLRTLDGLETRPTSELVKEAVFSIIQFETEGARVLDLFAGSGQMGIEALSRGARSCVFVEQAKACRAVIDENLKHTGLTANARVLGTDAIAFMRGSSELFDIAFLDPPYLQGFSDKLLEPLSKLMSESGVIICETSLKESLPEMAGMLRLYKEYRYGKTKITVYRHDTKE